MFALLDICFCHWISGCLLSITAVQWVLFLCSHCCHNSQQPFVLTWEPIESYVCIDNTPHPRGSAIIFIFLPTDVNSGISTLRQKYWAKIKSMTSRWCNFNHTQVQCARCDFNRIQEQLHLYIRVICITSKPSFYQTFLSSNPHNPTWPLSNLMVRQKYIH
jgi:hypothetical protein